MEPWMSAISTLPAPEPEELKALRDLPKAPLQSECISIEVTGPFPLLLHAAT